MDFVFKSSSSIHVAMEDDIRADLEAVGIAVKPVMVDAQDTFNQLNAVRAQCAGRDPCPARPVQW